MMTIAAVITLRDAVGLRIIGNASDQSVRELFRPTVRP